MMHRHAQIWKKRLLFFRPVVEHCSRTDNKKPVLFVSQQIDQGQGLVGFAQPHVIGQDAAKTVLVQLVEPGRTVPLV